MQYKFDNYNMQHIMGYSKKQGRRVLVLDRRFKTTSTFEVDPDTEIRTRIQFDDYRPREMPHENRSPQKPPHLDD
jgi:hypothetical protein